MNYKKGQEFKVRETKRINPGYASKILNTVFGDEMLVFLMCIFIFPAILLSIMLCIAIAGDWLLSYDVEI